MLRKTAPLALLLAAAGALAAPAEKAPPAPPAPEKIAQWVKDMDADSAAVRDDAVAKLTQAGKQAVGPVAQAAKGDSLEVTTRSITVLSNLLAGEDPAVKAAAKAALAELAKDEKHEAGKQARRALQAAEPRRPNRRDPFGGRINVGGAVIQLVPGGGAMQIAMANVNGEKTVDVNENGRKVKITEGKGGIVVTVTEKPEAGKKPEPKEYKAASEAELKKKHPEAHKLYEKYGKNQGAAGMANFQIIAGGGPGLVVQPGQIQARPVLPPRRGELAATGKLVDEAQKELDQAIAKLQAVVDSKENRIWGKIGPDEAAALVKQIESAKKKLAEARKSLPK